MRHCTVREVNFIMYAIIIRRRHRSYQPGDDRHLRQEKNSSYYARWLDVSCAGLFCLSSVAMSRFVIRINKLWAKIQYAEQHQNQCHRTQTSNKKKDSLFYFPFEFDGKKNDKHFIKNVIFGKLSIDITNLELNGFVAYSSLEFCLHSYSEINQWPIYSHRCQMIPSEHVSIEIVRSEWTFFSGRAWHILSFVKTINHWHLIACRFFLLE